MSGLWTLWRSVYGQRHLFWELVCHGVQGRFAGSFAGLLWTVLHPLAHIAIYNFLFSLVFRIRMPAQETGTDSFLIFFLTGYCPWLCFAEAVSRSTGSVVDNAVLVTKVFFPVEVLPFSTVTAGFLIHTGAWVLALLLMAAMGYSHISWLLMPLVLGILYVFALGLSLLLSALCVFIRDVREIITVVLTMWFYATPILYPIGFVPSEIGWLLAANPLTPMVQAARSVLLHHRIPVSDLLHGALWAGGLYIVGAAFFGRSRRAFGDVL